MLRILLTAAALVFALPLQGPTQSSAFAASPAQRCAAVKRKAAGKAAKGLASCDGKAVLRGVGVDLACVSHVGVQFARAWTRAERKGGCATSGDQLVVEGRIDAHDAQMQALLGAGGGFGSRCSAGKVRDSGRAAFCFLLCASKAAKTGVTNADPAIARCSAKCASKLAAAYVRAESRKDCRTTGDLAAASSVIGAFTDCISSLVGPNGSTPCSGSSTSTTTTNPGGTTSTTGAPSSTTLPGGTTSTTATSTTTVASTSSTSMPPLTQCCIPSSVGGAFTCVPETAGDCAIDGGTDMGAGTCTPDPCPATTTSSSTTTMPDPSTTITTTSTTSSSSTLLACGGLFPACLGSCPVGEACTALNVLDPCVCAPLPTSTTTTTLLACGGLYPACLGSCPVGEQCTAANLLDPCVCAPIPTSSTTTTTLLPCGGIAPACLGSCPVGQSCTGAPLGACSCQ